MKATHRLLTTVSVTASPLKHAFENAVPQRTQVSRRGWMAAAGSALLLTGCGSGVVTIEVPGLPRSYRVSMRDEEGHQIVTANINGTAVQLLLDTGADFNMLTPEAAARLGLKLSETTVPATGGSGDPVQAKWTTIDSLALGEARLSNSLAFVIPVPAEFPYDGVLGTNFFKAFTPRFEYARGELLLYSPESFVQPVGVDPIAITLVNDRKVLVEATMAGIKGWHSIDTGKQGALAIFRPSVERFGLRQILGPGVRMITGVSVGGHLQGDMVRTPQLQIGSHRLDNVITELSLSTTALYGSDGWMGNIGAEVWRRFAVTIDYRGLKLYLEPNDRLREPFRGPRTGIAFSLGASGVEIIEVLRDSPAGVAGATVGDAVIACNDRAVTRNDYAHLRAALRGELGSTMKLLLRDRSGSERIVTFMLRELV
jgi:clan AA aspartic protease (TIGR02281 family)